MHQFLKSAFEYVFRQPLSEGRKCGGGFSLWSMNIFGRELISWTSISERQFWETILRDILCFCSFAKLVTGCRLFWYFQGCLSSVQWTALQTATYNQLNLDRRTSAFSLINFSCTSPSKECCNIPGSHRSHQMVEIKQYP